MTRDVVIEVNGCSLMCENSIALGCFVGVLCVCMCVCVFYQSKISNFMKMEKLKL